jgi:plastocyanin
MPNRRRSLLAAALGAALIGVLAPIASGGDSARPAPTVSLEDEKPIVKRVAVNDNFYEPRSVTLPKGGRVLWTWKGENRHNVTFTRVPEKGSRRGSPSKRDGRWRRSFHRPGLYKYVCTLFTGMRGSVYVSAKKPPPPTNTN